MKQYDSALRKWWTHCAAHHLDPFQPDTSSALCFFTTYFNEGASYGTLNSARAALGLIGRTSLGEDACISRFFKGVHNLRPPAPRYSSTWDPATVLNHLCSIPSTDHTSIRELTLKLVTLIALVTAHRVQTLSLIQLPHITFSESGATINIALPIKTSRKGCPQPSLFFVLFSRQTRTLCDASPVVHSPYGCASTTRDR